MNKQNRHAPIPFTHQELIALKLFYSGVPARQIRPTYGDPWQLVSKHRNLPQKLFVAVRAKLDEVSLPDVTLRKD
jgi:hypothetical protein